MRPEERHFDVEILNDWHTCHCPQLPGASKFGGGFWMFLDVFGWLAFALGFIELKYFLILKEIRNDAEVESHGDTDAAGSAAKEHHLTFGTTAPTVGSGG